ncbi:MAG: hypothetical protein AAGN82_13245 [Myxococcota bacterium]
MLPTRRFTALFLVGLPISLATMGCGGDGGTGRAEIETWGEAFIEAGIPAEAFEDGWAVSFERFVVVLSDVTVADANGEGASLAEARAFDLVTPGPHGVGALDDLPSGNLTAVGYRTPVATDGTTAHESAATGDVEAMREAGFSIWASGVAARDQITKRFSWGFAADRRYDRCVDVGGGQEIDGVVVPNGGSVDLQLTIHGDHLFFDDLVSPEAGLRFAHMADADVDGDGEVTLAELDAVELSTIPPAEGSYEAGAADVNTLGDFVRASVGSLGHFNGEGHCAASGG